MDLESRRRGELYTKAQEAMLERTHTGEARWWIVEAVPLATLKVTRSP